MTPGAVILSLSLAGSTTGAEPAEPLQDQGATLVLSPRAHASDKAAVKALTVGMVTAAERFGGVTAPRDTDLAAATPGDIVARCPARISNRCLAEAAALTDARRTLTGVLQQTGEGYLVQLRVVDAATGERVALRSVRVFPAPGDQLDLQLAGECVALDVLWGSVGRGDALRTAGCADRVFPTSWGHRKRFASSIRADAEDFWLTVIPDAATRSAYEDRNRMLSGAFASSLSVAVVGAATAALLGVRSMMTGNEAVDLARAHPEAFDIEGGEVTVQNELDGSVTEFRRLEDQGRMESFAGLGVGTIAATAAIGAAALYYVADIPGRYAPYRSGAQEQVETAE